jgi:putative ABC transport system permease protein
MTVRAAPRHAAPAPPRRLGRGSHFGLRDLFRESTAGMLQRTGRTSLTMLGTVVGVGAFVAVLGLSSTAAGQISAAFSVLKATTVTVTDAAAAAAAGNAAGTTRPAMSFPDDADDRASALNGVVAAGVWWPVPGVPTLTPNLLQSGASSGQGLSVYAASAGAVAAMDLHLVRGTQITGFDDASNQHVAMLSSAAAARLNINRLAAQPVIFVGGVEFLVIGIYDTSPRVSDPLLGVIIPAQTALKLYGNPDPAQAPARMLIDTRIGAAQLVASQAAVALNPAAPDDFTVTAPPDPHRLQNHVTADLASLYVGLAVICLIIGAIGIANSTLIGVLERTGEIGLRRSLGARPRHIAAQFLTESTLQGTVAGLVGTAAGIVVVVAVALARQWTAVLEPALTVPAPLLGTVAGLLAGLYPALRAARTDPIRALRS